MIKILDKHVADKIAAGEVIDRPISIIKELVENSLDAEATSITVEIRSGGKEYIRVTDDGTGIDGSEAEVAFSRHATSKITEEEDLRSIGTLGFRGEALASIAAVSRVEMITSTGDGMPGRSVRVEGGRIISNEPVGCPKGTTITVRDLFYNVPARLKFLASDNGETRRITDMLSRIALAYPDVRFRLINGKKDVFNTTGNGIILDNILRIYGRDLEKDLLPVDHTKAKEGFVLRGFISKPSFSLPSRNRQYFCVNGRVVSSKTIEKGLEKGYRERLFAGRHPMAFLFLSLPGDTVDVNVHPTKKEIRFNDPFSVEDMIEEAVKQALLTEESIPIADDRRRIRTVDEPVPSKMEIRTEIREDIPSEKQVDVKSLLETMRSEVDEKSMSYDQGASSENTPEDTDAPDAHPEIQIGAMDIVGTVLDTYIIAQLSDVMYLIDQHAAHERVLYERFIREYHNSDTPSQSLLVPLQITVTADTAASEEDWMEELHKMGYSIEPFGDRVYIVREYPAFLSAEDSEAFIKDFVMGLDENPDLRDFADLERIIMRSCKSAVKGGDSLHRMEIKALLEQLSQCDNPYSCPHGRPVFVKMTRYDLEKLFKRA